MERLKALRPLPWYPLYASCSWIELCILKLKKKNLQIDGFSLPFSEAKVLDKLTNEAYTSKLTC